MEQEKKKLNVKIIIPIVAVIIAVIVGIVLFTSKDKKDLISIEKIYYTELNNDYSMYVVYSIKSDEKENITTSGGSTLKSSIAEYENSLFTYDRNKSVIEKAGFPTLVSYKTLYAGSEQELKYVAHFSIGKKEINENSKLKLRVKINGTASSNSFATTYDYLEKEFIINEDNSFLYTENTEFIEQFEKDYNK